MCIFCNCLMDSTAVVQVTSVTTFAPVTSVAPVKSVTPVWIHHFLFENIHTPFPFSIYQFPFQSITLHSFTISSSECKIIRLGLWCGDWLFISFVYLQLSMSGWLTGHYSFKCQPLDRSTHPRTMRVSISNRAGVEGLIRLLDVKMPAL